MGCDKWPKGVKEVIANCKLDWRCSAVVSCFEWEDNIDINHKLWSFYRREMEKKWISGILFQSQRDTQKNDLKESNNRRRRSSIEKGWGSPLLYRPRRFIDFVWRMSFNSPTIRWWWCKCTWSLICSKRRSPGTPFYYIVKKSVGTLPSRVNWSGRLSTNRNANKSPPVKYQWSSIEKGGIWRSAADGRA